MHLIGKINTALKPDAKIRRKTESHAICFKHPLPNASTSARLSERIRRRSGGAYKMERASKIIMFSVRRQLPFGKVQKLQRHLQKVCTTLTRASDGKNQSSAKMRLHRRSG